MSARTTLTREEKRALLNLHIGKIREALAAIEVARAPFDAARDELTARIDEAKGDLGKNLYPRKYLLSLVNDQTAKTRDQAREEAQRYEDRQDLSLPVVGDQLMLSLDSTATPDEAKDELYWEAEGFRLGRLGKLDVIPEGCPPRFHQKVMQAAAKGQEITQTEVAAAMAAKKRIAEPQGDKKPKDLNATTEPEPGTPEAKKAERKSVAAAKESLEAMGKKGRPADDFEAGPEELAKQGPRLAVVKGRATEEAASPPAAA